MYKKFNYYKNISKYNTNLHFPPILLKCCHSCVLTGTLDSPITGPKHFWLISPCFTKFILHSQHLCEVL